MVSPRVLFAVVAAAAVLALPLASSAQTANTWTGNWNTSYGEMTLTQSGAQVTGNYILDDGHVTGTVSGNVLTGRWDEAPTRTGPNDAGPLRFTMAADGESFTGVWGYDGEGGTTSHTWDGTCTSGPCFRNVPPPVLGKNVSVAEVSGSVRVAAPGTTRFVPLTGGKRIPVGSLVDTNDGTVRLTSAVNAAGSIQSANFSRGVFKVRQARRAGAVTELGLMGGSFDSCAPGKLADSARRRRSIRRLLSSGRGRFRTRGRYSASTVRGTKWLTVDRCDGTLTQVLQGAVTVRDFARDRNVVVRAGRSYLASP
jgi:hypothetical protein